MKDAQVLIVEDDPMVSEMVRGKLKQAGYPVVGNALDGEQALQMVRMLHPDVILMDIEMPGMDGLEAARRIYEDHPTPVVMLTAYENAELVQQASRVGAGAYLIKPPNCKELERAITISMARFRDLQNVQHLNAELQNALEQIRTLSGLLPICAHCKKIRDEAGHWHHLELYIQQHTDVEFSHGLCPDCLHTLYADFIDE